MLIVITGAQGSGKSTLCELVKKWIRKHTPYKCYLHSSVTSNSFYSKNISYEEMNTADILEIFHRYIERETDYREGIHLFDRCSLDALAYLHVLSPPGEEIMEELLNQMHNSLRKMRFIFGLGVGEYYPRQTRRDEPFEFRKAVYDSMLQLSKRRKMPFYDLSTSNYQLDDIVSLVQKDLYGE